MCNSSAIVVHWSFYMANGNAIPTLSTRKTTSVRGDGDKYTLACEISDLGWTKVPNVVDVVSHVTGAHREFMLLREVRCEAQNETQLWIFVCPTQPNTTLHVYND